jgi:hypothetical protein
MTLDPKEAAASLSDIDSVEQRTREALVYERSSDMLILWGVVVACGYVLTYALPGYSNTAWLVLTAAGVGGGLLIRRWRKEAQRGHPTLGQRLFYAQLVLIAYGALLMLLLWPVITYRQIGAFWPVFVMFGHVLAGLWLGRFFIYLGITVTALVVAGYFWVGAWYPLWLAVVVGGGLIAAGLWLRRLG